MMICTLTAITQLVINLAMLYVLYGFNERIKNAET